MSTPARVLRWSYAVGQQHCDCEIVLDARHSLYEFRIRRGGRRRAIVEFYRDIHHAVARHAEFEAVLLDDGYSLEHFDARERMH